MEFEPHSRILLGAAIEVHRELGPRLLESAYQRCLLYELGRLGVSAASQVSIPLRVRDLIIPSAYRADLIVDASILVEVKSIAKVEPIHRAQLLTYLRLTGLHTGFILNFNVAVMKEGIHRMVL